MMTPATTPPSEVGTSALFAVGDGADLTLTRSSQGRIELEVRTKHGALKLGLTEADFASLLFGQAHVSTLVTRYLPKRVTLTDSANGGRAEPHGPERRRNDMNEVNAISTSEAGLDGSSVLLASRFASGQQDAGFTSSPPLAGGRCPACERKALWFTTAMCGCGACGRAWTRDTGQRSGPANAFDVATKPAPDGFEKHK